MKVITTHLNADFDSFGSMLAAGKLYPDALLVFSGSMEKSLRDYLKSHPSPCVITRLKDIDLDSVELLVVVDTQEKTRIGPFGELPGKPGVEVHIYDHHLDPGQPMSSQKKTVLKRGSSCTVMFEILRERGVALTPEESTLLALGIYEDTHSLSSSTAVAEDLFAAARLVEMGADLQVVARFVEPRLNRRQIAVTNQLIQDLRIHHVNGAEVGVATAVADEYVDDLSFAVHKIRELENLPCLFALIQMDQRIYMIARSQIEEINAARVLKKFGGNGHAGAASASPKNMTLVQTREKLLQVLEEEAMDFRKVEDLMHSPAVTVEENDPVETAEKILTRFNLNTLPVLKENRPVGLVTRQTVEKAIHHGMANEPASEIMFREFAATTPDSLFRSVISVIIEEKQKLIPVVDETDGKIVGVVSRGDLLRVLHQDRDRISGDKDLPGLPQAKQVKSLMKERLPKNEMQLFQVMAETADETEMSVYLVGGFVRDILMGIENLDVDVVVEGDGVVFARALAKKLGGKVRSHDKFCTGAVELDNGIKVDVATARMEYYLHPGALPSIEKSSIKADLYRRDFSINSLAIKLNGKNAFCLIDYFNGQRDIRDRTIRILHNLSFVEDPTRAFRAVRFEQRFRFSLGRQTLAFLKSAVKKRLLDGLSGHRIWAELELILREAKPMRCIRRMNELELFRFIHPDLEVKPDSLNGLERIPEALAGSRMVPSLQKPEVWKVYLYGLLFGGSANILEIIMERLGFSRRLADKTRIDFRGCGQVARILKRGKEPDSCELYDAFSELSPEAIFWLMASEGGEKLNQYVLLFYTRYRPAARLSLTGDDLLAMGFDAGPVFQDIFRTLRKARLEGRVKSREEELEFVKKEFLNAKK